MDFQDKLQSLLGETVEVITGIQVTTGVLIRVTDSTATVLTSGASGYGNAQNVVFQLDRITYVRLV
ncbi:hypothetical protein [Brevibacillus centrosporus]|jgi:hypothetical protein|uniref:Uncharacterized protein n=1 Tax=Brevibacillus centrosporus TaxID=54910 RepID=A0A1I3VM10_9BACL|nr:hypothetical protein [Brevibacillus centrosporus]MEC2130840.1 hypothetical protein [Brevibacillus centrosporus]RNB69141.1 hypothetical protein EDM55_14325 [Brevibacillus centrosporus]GED31432.1 hypothetical protein BCE02nite_25730 [Brevibacillus centrosporus]SFJ95181.1 hypothetical protein SAMN05518846_10732 [Brevibacillus centrosporus]